MSWLIRFFTVVCLGAMFVLLSWSQPERVIESKQTPIPIFPKEEGYHPLLVHIPGGRFLVGEVASRREEAHQDLGHRPRKAHISYDYLIMSTELSNRIASQLKKEKLETENLCMGDCPRSNISWYDAVEYANLLSEKTGLETCYIIEKKRVRWPKGVACLGYRLPLEEEWEYAAKAGRSNVEENKMLNSIAWHKGNSLQRPHPIATREPNELLLYDMLGNLSEWCWDRWDKSSKASQRQRTLRGGNWRSELRELDAEHREVLEAKQRSYRSGVRFVRTLP